MSGLAFLVLLPCATWLLGSVLGLLDVADRAAALRRTAWRGLPFLAAGLLLGSDALWPTLWAVAAALGLHLAVFLGVRGAVQRGWTSRASWWRD